MEKLPIYYGVCCTVWPLVLGYKYGRCGRCGVQPTIIDASLQNKTRAELEDHFYIKSANRCKENRAKNG